MTQPLSPVQSQFGDNAYENDHGIPDSSTVRMNSPVPAIIENKSSDNLES